MPSNGLVLGSCVGCSVPSYWRGLYAALNGCMGACVPCVGVVSSDAIKWAVYGSMRACRACVLGLVSLLWVEWTRLVNGGLDLWTWWT